MHDAAVAIKVALLLKLFGHKNLRDNTHRALDKIQIGVPYGARDGSGRKRIIKKCRDTVLAKIVADKYEWVAERKRPLPLEGFRHQVQPNPRSFYHALSGTSTAFILECKKTSPSKGIIRSDFNPVAIAGVYWYYASTISVLTDEKYCQGSFDFLRQVSRTLSQPVLYKDFILIPGILTWRDCIRRTRFC